MGGARGARGTAEEEEARRTWKLHVKHVSRIDGDKVLQLPVVRAETRQRFEYARGWLWDLRRYAPVPVRGADGAPRARLSEAWVASLEEHGIVREIHRDEVRGWVTMFAVAEPAKERFRPIKNPKDVNAVLGKDTILPMRFPSKREIVELVLAGTHFIALDFASYYDQFEYTPEVAQMFCFRELERYFRLVTMSMGQRHAVEVAQTTTDVINDFAHESTTKTIIDNAIFAGSREAVVRDGQRFVERVHACGGQLNEDVTDVAALATQEGSWGGVRLNMANKTVALMEKTVTKVEASWQRREQWTWRGFAAHVGLLFWSWGILDVPMADFFSLLTFVSRVGRAMTDADDSQWDAPARVWDSVWPDLERWTRICTDNAPRVVRPRGRPEWLICTDASRWGWGYVAVNEATGELRQYGAPWSQHMERQYGDKHLGSSVFAEPYGVVNSLCHLLRPGEATRVVVGTDSTVARAAFARGYNSHSVHINRCIRRLQEAFGDLTIEFVHIPGISNPADGLSRGALPAAADDRVLAAGVRQAIGATPELGHAADAAGAPRDVAPT